MKGMTQEKNWENVFVHFSDPPEEPKSIWAKQGRLNFYPEMRRAVLELSNGVIHSYSLSQPEKYGVTSFEHFEQEINVENFFSPTLVKRVKEKDIEELLRDIKVINQDLATLSKEKEGAEEKKFEYGRRWKDYLSYWVEIYKKFSLPFACLVFGFLSLPLGASTKKGGRTSGFTISLGIILVYYVLITAGEKMAMDGKISPFLGMWGANILLLLVGLALFVSSLKESVPYLGFLRLSKEKEGSPAPGKKKVFSRKWFRLSLRFPNILDRYILKKYLAIFSLIFFGLILIFAIVTFFERIDNIYEHSKPLSLLFEYIFYSIPDFIRYIFPVAALTTTLLSLGLLAKFNEITAMKACGISLYRIILPVLAMAILASSASFYIQENILPYANKKVEETWDKMNDVPPRSHSYLDRRWVLSKDKNRIYHYNYFDLQKTAFSQLSIYDFDSSWSLKRRIFSEKAYLNDGRLSLVNCWDREFVDGKLVKFEKGEKMEVLQVEDKSYFLKEWKEPSQMSFGELRQYIKEIEESNFNTVRFKVDLLYKTSFPLVSLVMTLLGLPFAFSMGKRGTLVGIGLSVAIAMVYWGAIGIFQGLGYQNYLNAFLAAWGPNLIFGLIGLYLVFALRT
jgi:LPS export ABC transporter permease LptG